MPVRPCKGRCGQRECREVAESLMAQERGPRGGVSPQLIEEYRTGSAADRVALRRRFPAVDFSRFN